MVRIAAYPWHALEQIDRGLARTIGAARRRLNELRTQGLAPALGELIGADAKLVLVRLSAPSRTPRGLLLPFEIVGEAARVTFGIEPALATRVIATLVGRSITLDRLDASSDPALLGALAAVVVESVRRAGGLPALAPAGGVAPHFETRSAALLEVMLILDGRGYALDVLLELDASTVLAPSPELASLGSLPIALTLVAGISLATAAELATLELGGAWLPGRGSWIDVHGAGRAALASALGERGVAVDLAPNGRIVLRGNSVVLSASVEHSMSDDDPTSQGLSQTALEAPVVVRVEVGSVTLSAREWAALRPGDVIETGRRIAEPVVLRVAGRELARGELVDIEGELGVRVRELMPEDSE